MSMDDGDLAQMAYDSVPPEFWCDWGEERSLHRQAEDWAAEHGVELCEF
jgi:hypothetical protein